MKKLLIGLLLAQMSSMAFADTIVTQTSNWKSVPIVVDPGTQVYRYEGQAPEGDYYYSYTGHRCFTEKRDIVGVNAIIFHAGVPGGSDIYCYAE